MRKTRRRFLVAVGATLAIAGCQDGGAGPTPEGSPGESPGDGDGLGDGTPTPGDEVESPTPEDGVGDGTPTEEDGVGDGTPTEEDGVGDGTGTPGDGGRVEVSEHDEYGEILVDGEGMTLYMFDADTQGEEGSACTDDCLENWPPLIAEGEPEAGEGVTAELTTFEREDGDMQVAANGWPLYYFADDMAEGDANGQGLNDAWFVLDPAGEPVMDGGDGREAGTATGTPS